MTSRRNATKHSTAAEPDARRSFESVWDAIEDDPAERQRMKLLSSLMINLNQHIKVQGWTQKTAAEHLGVTQPRVSDLMRGKINLFSIDALVGMSGAAGIELDVRFKT